MMILCLPIDLGYLFDPLPLVLTVSILNSSLQWESTDAPICPAHAQQEARIPLKPYLHESILLLLQHVLSLISAY